MINNQPFKKKDENTMLHPLKSTRKFKYSVMDIETFHWTDVQLVGFYDGEKYYAFHTVKEWLDFFLTRKYSYWRCFAHFGAGFDFNFVMAELEKSFPQFKVVILSNNGASMIKIYDKLNSGGRAWMLLDSYRLLPKSLAELTKSFDVEHKKKENVDREHLEKISWEEMREYNEYDCKGLYEVIEKFSHWFAKYKVPLRPTTASQAMATYRRMMKFAIPNLKPDVEKFIRDSYYGGRVEVFKMRCFDKMKVYDFTSLYPYVMKKYPMPVGTASRVTKFYENTTGFYKATVKIPDMYFPPMPWLNKQKLIFPTGKFSGIYASKELEMARLLGCEFNIDYGYIFPDAYIFDEYVDMMFKLKQTGDGATKAIAKLMLNSLYGKFGQNRNKQTIVKTDIAHAVGLKPFNDEHDLYIQESESRATFIIPSISAWVTSCARVELLQMLLKAGEENAYYADTDSIFSTKNLPTSDKLGGLKVEAEADEAIFVLPKLYVLRTGDKLITKAKGFERDFTNKLSFNSFDKALHGDRSDFVQVIQRFGKFKESLKREGRYVTMLTKKKSIKSEYDKRTWDENFNTVPRRVNQDMTLQL